LQSDGNQSLTSHRPPGVVSGLNYWPGEKKARMTLTKLLVMIKEATLVNQDKKMLKPLVVKTRGSGVGAEPSE